MILITRELLPYILDRISGVDGYYSAFRLAFYYGYDPRSTTGGSGLNVLAQFDFASPWGTQADGNNIYKVGPISTPVTASGKASYWRLLGLQVGVWETVVHGSMGLIGSGADIKVRTLDWVLGDPLTLEVIQIFPIKLSY